MKRQPIENGTWFDLRKATRFEESTYWDGSNHISKATGSQWYHEDLYRTATGNWVLNSWSNWQGSREVWEQQSDAEAAAWLVGNCLEIPKELEEIAARLEV